MKLAAAVIAFVALLALGGCQEERRPDLAEVLAHADGQIADERGQAVSVEEILAAARDRPVSVSFAYVGCGGGRPRMARLNEAAKAVPDAGDVLHVVLNLVDDPSRFPDLVRDLSGRDATTLDGNRIRVAFLAKPDLWPATNGAAVEGIMRDMGLRFGSQAHIETVNGIGVFDRAGRFVGIRY